ncbi:MAG: hypothetical protein K0R99_4687 [Microbacterium sp.]|jgi:hypothetical protein|uniref:hypothetical protein n=1 Tax=Microbacterium sp. TaxID=51671 RepID=UPI00262BD755|nr:hypothetical protein [Microbacterium sp.]MDF2563241.1 hypothetical protein [Microbacterium sp.]
MKIWNPAGRARNFVARMHAMSERVVSLQEDLGGLRSEVDALAAQVAGLRDESEQTQRLVLDTRTALEHTTAVAGRAAQRATLRRDRTRVVFLIHNRDAWDAIGELIDILRDEPDFEPIVVSIPHQYGGDAAPRGEGRVHRFLSDRTVPHVRVRNDDIASAAELLLALDPDVVFRQSQWDADVDAAFSPASLAWTRLAIVPYETMNPTHNVPWDYPPVNSAVDQHFHRAAWLVFCANDEALQIARADSLTGARQFRVVGHPKADALRRTMPRWPGHDDTTTRPRRVLWSAHHSILNGWNDFGMLPRVKDDMLRWAREEPRTEFVFTHHPYLRGSIRRSDSPLTDLEFKEWLAEWQLLPNTYYERGPYAPLLAATDLLVTDGPSMITESQVLTIPTVFLEREDHVEFNSLGDVIVAGVHRVPDVARARAIASAMAAGDPLAHVQRANVAHLFGAPGAARRIVEVMRAEIRTEHPPRR